MFRPFQVLCRKLAKTGHGDHSNRRLVRPRLLTCEDRVTPATLVVSSIADSGVGSLRAAIATAVDGDSVVFSKSLNNKTITLTSGELSISQDISIVGLGASKLTISGKDTQRIFAVTDTAQATISGLRLVDGRATAGGAVSNDGELTLQQVALLNNDAVGGIGGGAIWNQEGAMLTLTQSLVNNNTATAAAGYACFGGGLLNQGFATVVSSTFSGNLVTGGTKNCYGGGISNYAGGELSLSESIISGNRAVAAAGSSYGGGGGVSNDGGLTLYEPSSATISNCTIVNNVATGGEGTANNGGGVLNTGFDSTMNLLHCVISGNRAVGGNNGDGLTALSQGLGGGIVNGLGSIMTLSRSTVSGNQAIGGDNATNTAANPHTGAGLGGGIENILFANLTISHCIIDNNTAKGGVTNFGPGGNAIGGGIENAVFSTLTITDSIVMRNSAVAGRGGAGVSTIPAGVASGGGIDNQFISHAIVDGCLITLNQATGGGGGPGNSGNSGFGGGISMGINAYVGTEFPEGSTLELSNSIVALNTARGGTGGTGGNGGNGFGGGLFIFARPTDTDVSVATIESTILSLNFAFGGLRGTGGSNGQGVGGGIYNDNGDFTLDASSHVLNNFASTSNNNIYP